MLFLYQDKKRLENEKEEWNCLSFAHFFHLKVHWILTLYVNTYTGLHSLAVSHEREILALLVDHWISVRLKIFGVALKEDPDHKVCQGKDQEIACNDSKMIDMNDCIVGYQGPKIDPKGREKLIEEM